MSQNNNICKIRVKLQYKSYKGYFYYVYILPNSTFKFSAILNKMFCANYILSSTCKLEIDYDTSEFSCILKDNNGNEYELVDDLSRFNLYIVESEIVTSDTEENLNSGIDYYDFRIGSAVKIKVTLKFAIFNIHYYLNVYGEKGLNALVYADLSNPNLNLKETIESDCNAKIKNNYEFCFETKNTNNQPIKISLPLNNICEYITKIEIVDVIK